MNDKIEMPELMDLKPCIDKFTCHKHELIDNTT